MAPWGQHKDTAVKLHVTLLDGREYMYEAMPHDTIAAIKVHLEFETRIEAEFEVDGPKGKTEKKEKGKKEKKEKPIENMSLWLGGLGRPHRLKNGETIQVGVVQEMEHVTKRPVRGEHTHRARARRDDDRRPLSRGRAPPLRGVIIARALRSARPQRRRRP
jgi:hypothetical protein